MIRTQKQVELFDELMKKTKEKHKMIQQLCKQQLHEGISGNTKSAMNTIIESTTISDQPTTISNLEISKITDEYGRNIARIRIPRSILYENAIEIKKSDEDDDEESTE
ncbi:Pyridoxal 5'-phosphate synthase subunit PdxS [Dirofilaria immitis]